MRTQRATVDASRPLLTVRDVSSRLGISLSHAYVLTNRGDIATYRIGKCVRVREEDLDHFLEDRRHEVARQLPPTGRHF